MDKRSLFPVCFAFLKRVPTREELFWTRHHLVRMKEGLSLAQNPYVYISMQPEAVKLGYILGDLNRTGESLWPVRLTTNLRVAESRRVLRQISSHLNLILKEYH